VSPASPIPPAVVTSYEALIAGEPGVERKGAKNPYTSLNGNMFSFLASNHRLAIRLPEDLRAELIAKRKGTECIQYGAVMRGYVELPAGIWKQRAELKKLFAASHAFAKTLKAKPTTRKKTAKKATKKATTRKAPARKA